MTTRTASCRCGRFRTAVTDDSFFGSPAFSVWEARKHEWVEISGEGVEHIR